MLKVLDSAVPVACWSCSVAHNDVHALLPALQQDSAPARRRLFFRSSACSARFKLDLAALEHEFHRLSRKLHPDRFARASENEREWSLADTALLNDAYRTLKDPLHRTEYLLKLAGRGDRRRACRQEIARRRKDPSRVPADLLEEVFELNMQLEEMRMARKMGEDRSRSSQTEPASRQRRNSTACCDAVDRDLRAQWQVWDEGDEAARQAAKTAMVALLDRRRYLSNLVRDVTETLGA